MKSSIEQRLIQLEAAVRELQQQRSTSETNWLKEISGSFADDPIFDEVLAYGRELRQANSLRPTFGHRPSDNRSES